MRSKFVKFTFVVAFGLALALTFSCSSGDDSGDSGLNGGSDKGNDITNYETKQIGDQVWMVENLNYNVVGSKCGGNNNSLYDKNTINCGKYGRLYNWTTAMALPDSCYSKDCASQIGAKHKGICPNGWHIPSSADWDKLLNYVESNSGCISCAGKHLKASDWNGLDTYGFSALPGGIGGSSGVFYSVGSSGYWWGASENNNYDSYYRKINYDSDKVYYDYDVVDNLLSVRCVQD